MTGIADSIASAIGADRLVTDEAAVASHQTDYWILAHLRRRQGRLAPPPLVVQPRNPAEVAAVVKLARTHGTPIVPYGGGSGVVGGATPEAGALVVDLRRMDQLLEVSDTALTARAQAGLLGGEFERLLNARGYASGHYPQSLALASLGGLVATRSAGQFSTLYGNMEDLCLGLEVVLPSGEIARLRPTPRSATGPSLREIFLGSEGTLGIVTEVTVRIFPTPERQAMSAWTFDGMVPALDAIRRIMRVGWRPAVVRLYDAFEASQWHFKQWVPENKCALLLLSEGPAALVAAEERACADIAGAAGGSAIGVAPVEHWLERRNHVPSWDQFFDQEMMVDTIEVSATWDRVVALYDGVIAALKARPGMLVASAHSSHSYRQGTNLYITFAVKPEKFADAEAAYVGAWSAVMEATLAAGGSISHHHGIGRMRVPWIARELGSAYPVLQTLKRALDPDGLMNPGVLLPR